LQVFQRLTWVFLNVGCLIFPHTEAIGCLYADVECFGTVYLDAKLIKGNGISKTGWAQFTRSLCNIE
jgi:hypothetical protein